MKRQTRKASQKLMTRHYRRRGVDVEIREAKDHVELKLDGKPIPVRIIDGEVHCQLASMFSAFGSVDDVVDTLLANEGRTWTLHGHVCDERCQRGEHHPDHSHDHGHGHDHEGRGGER